MSQPFGLNPAILRISLRVAPQDEFYKVRWLNCSQPLNGAAVDWSTGTAVMRPLGE